MAKSKKKIPAIIAPGGAIPTPALRPQKVRFSFEFLDFTNDKFHHSRCADGYFEHFCERLKNVSSLVVTEFCRNHSYQRVLHSHAIDFGRTTERQGFLTVRPERWEGRAWQFSITVNEHGRVHGFIDGDVFYVVWIDPDHLLCP